MKWRKRPNSIRKCDHLRSKSPMPKYDAQLGTMCVTLPLNAGEGGRSFAAPTPSGIDVPDQVRRRTTSKARTALLHVRHRSGCDPSFLQNQRTDYYSAGREAFGRIMLDGVKFPCHKVSREGWTKTASCPFVRHTSQMTCKRPIVCSR